MAVRSRVRRGGGFVLLLALMLLVGRGVGWLPFGGGGGTDAAAVGADPKALPGLALPGLAPSELVPAGSVDSAAEHGSQERGSLWSAAMSPPTASPAPVQLPRGPVSAMPTSSAATSASTRPTTSAPAPEPPVPAAPAAASPAVVPGPVPDAAPRPEFDDRRAARCAMARAALVDGRLGAAMAALDAIDPDDAAVAEVSALREAATEQLGAACSAWVAAVQAGELHAARRQLELLLRPRSAAVVAALEALCAARDWPGVAAVAPAIVDAPSLPRAAIALADRRVRLPTATAGERVRVVAQGEQGVTVRAVGADGVTFPTLAPWLVEPEGVTAAEATELGLLAAHAGDGQAARLWCACALALAPARSERLLRLRAALP